jgi:hypothetical protein
MRAVWEVDRQLNTWQGSGGQLAFLFAFEDASQKK